MATDSFKELADLVEDKDICCCSYHDADSRNPHTVSPVAVLSDVAEEDDGPPIGDAAIGDLVDVFSGQRLFNAAGSSSTGGAPKYNQPVRDWTAPKSKKAVIGVSSSKPKKKGKVKGNPKKPPRPNFMLSRAFDNPVVKSFGAVSGQAKELRVSATDFLDYEATTAAPVLNYVFRDKQSYFASGPIGGVEENVARLEKVEVWALPRASNAAIATTSFASLYSTPAFNKGDGVSGAQPRQTSQRTTMVNPTFNTKWMKLGQTDFRKVFSDVVVTPVEVVQDDENTGLLAFQLFLIDPDSSNAYTDKVQLRVKTTWVQTLPVMTTAQIGRIYLDSFSTIPAAVAFQPEFTITELKSIVDRS